MCLGWTTFVFLFFNCIVCLTTPVQNMHMILKNWPILWFFHITNSSKLFKFFQSLQDNTFWVEFHGNLCLYGIRSLKTRTRFRARSNWEIIKFWQIYDFQNRYPPNWGSKTFFFDLIVSPIIILYHVMQFKKFQSKLKLQREFEFWNLSQIKS